jgi:hypothetical protein
MITLKKKVESLLSISHPTLPIINRLSTEEANSFINLFTMGITGSLGDATEKIISNFG